VLAVKDLYSFKVAKFVKNQLQSAKYHVFSNYFVTVAHNSYPNTRNKCKLRVPRTRTVNGGKMIRSRGAQIWNSLTDSVKQDLTELSQFQFNQIVKSHYLQVYRVK
jgi:hypothetical protein